MISGLSYFITTVSPRCESHKQKREIIECRVRIDGQGSLEGHGMLFEKDLKKGLKFVKKAQINI